MDTPGFSPCCASGVLEGQYNDANPGEVTAEGSSQTFNISWQLALANKTSKLETLYHDLTERLAWVEKEVSKKRVWSDSVDTRLQFLESTYRQHDTSDYLQMQGTSYPNPPCQEGYQSYQQASSGGVTQKYLQEKEEYKKMKETIKELETRNKELLSKVMGMHKHSENMNDPSRLSAVLHMYEMLRLHDWEKLRCSTMPSWTYKTGSSLIKKLFDACEKTIEQKITTMFQVLNISPSNDAMTNSKQRMMQDIRNLLRYSYYNNHLDFYDKIVMEAGLELKTATQKQFALQCCKTYCLLLLLDPPVEAVWNVQDNPVQYLEHVDKKDLEHWRKASLLWPIMKCGEQVIVKGVVWD